MMVGVDEAGKIDYRTTIRDTTVLPGSCSKKALGLHLLHGQGKEIGQDRAAEEVA